jgi:hypothetical protein
VPALAAELETAGKAGDIPFIRKKLSAFVKQLTQLVQNIRAVPELFPNGDSAPSNNNKAIDISAYGSALQELIEALKAEKISDIKRILNELNRQTGESNLKKILEQISDQVLITEFNNAVKIVEELFTVSN